MLAIPHDRHIDRVPADAGHASFGKVLPDAIPASIKISVNLVSAGQTQKDRLGWPISLMRKATPGTPLTGLPGIDGNDGGTDFLGLVSREGPKLGVTPAMVPPPLLAASLLGPSTDAREVFEDDDAARFHALNDPLAQNVVTVPPKPCLTAAHLLQMALGRLAAFGLKTATKAEVPFFNLLPAALSEELPVGQNGGSVDAEINADDLTGRRNLGSVNGNDDVEPPAGRMMDKISAVETGRPVEPATGVGMDVKRELDPARHGGQADKSVLGFHAVGPGVVPDRSAFSMRNADLAPLLRHYESGLDCFRRFHAGRNHQLTRKLGMICPQVVVRCLMQRHAVPHTVFPSVFRDRVEAVPTARQRLRQDGILLGRGIKPYGNRALHGSYMASFLQIFKFCSAEFPLFLCRMKSAVSMRGVR